MGTRILWVIFLSSTAPATAWASADAGPPPLLVVNKETATKGAETGSVAFLDPATLRSTGSLDLGLTPAGAVLSPDETVMYVFAGPKGRGPQGTLAVVDVTSRRLVATIDAGEEPWPVGFSPDGSRLYTLTDGAKDRKAVLTVVDRGGHRPMATLELPATILDAVLSPDGARVWVLRRAGKEGPVPLLSVDTAKGVVAREQPVGHQPARLLLSPDKRWLYVLDVGDPSRKAAEHKDGAVVVLDAAADEVVATLPVGAGPAGMALDHEGGRVYVAGRPAPEAKTGVVWAIEGREVSGRLELDDRPTSLRVGPARGELVVVGERSVSVVDAGLGSAKRLALDLDHVVSADGRAAAAAVSSTPLLAGALVAAAAALARGQEQVTIDRFSGWAAGQRAVAEPFAAVAARPDGRFVYGLDSLSNKVVVLDPGTQQSSRISTGQGAYEIHLSPGGRHLYVQSVTELTVIGTSDNAVVARHDLVGGVKSRPFVGHQYARRELGLIPARRSALIAASKKLHLLNLRTGLIDKVVADLPSPLAVLVPTGVNVLAPERAAVEDVLDKASAFEQEGRIEEAVAEYRKVQALAPDDPTWVRRAVGLYEKSGQAEAALEEMKRWAAERPADTVRCWAAASLFVSRARHRDAIGYLECAASASPPLEGVPPGLIQLELARGHLAAGNREAALRLAEEAEKLGDARAPALLKQLRSGR